MADKNNSPVLSKDRDYLYKMQNSGLAGAHSSWVQMLPLLLFAAVTIVIVRLHYYQRPVGSFFWTAFDDNSTLTDFFSYSKMFFAVAVTVLAIALMFARVVKESFSVKRSKVYIPMAVYAVFVFISYIGSNYKIFALLGYNDRFEGTVPLLCYMIMLFYAINTINSEKNVKQLIFAVAVVSALLGILGVFQAGGHDLFMTEFGQKLVIPNKTLADGTSTWDAIESAFAEGRTYFSATFGGIWQTVYNPNYVSFYISMLIPVFGMLFLRAFAKGSDVPVWEKAGLTVLLGLLLFNMLGSRSTGGFVGLAAAFILWLIVLNKQLKKYAKPLIAVIIAIVIIMGVFSSYWLSEFVLTFKEFGQKPVFPQATEASSYGSVRPYIDYIKTGDAVEISLNGNPMIISYDEDGDDIYLNVTDSDGNTVMMNYEGDNVLSIDDSRFYPYATIGMTTGDDARTFLIVTTGGSRQWIFSNVDGTYYCINSLAYPVEMDKIEHVGFEDSQDFGTARGYIWSRTIPLLKHTIIKGYGADTFCIAFPQNDYAGRYNTNTYYEHPEVIVDKAHNTYLHAAVGTGVVSVCALIVLYGMYFVRSLRLFWRRDLSGFLDYAGFGLFIGLFSFMISGLCYDSSISIMPLFYSLLGCGIAVNMMLSRSDK